METLRIGGRRYSDPAVISLFQQTGGLIDPRSTVVHMARSLLGKISGFPGVPRDPLERLKIIASLAGIKIQPMDMDRLQTIPILARQMNSSDCAILGLQNW